MFVLYRKLLKLSGDTLLKGDCRKLKFDLVHSIQTNRIHRDVFGLNPLIKDMQTAVIVAEEIGMRRASILGVMLHDSVRCGTYTIEDDQLTVTLETWDEPSTYTFSVDDTSLTMNENSGYGISGTFTKK